MKNLLDPNHCLVNGKKRKNIKLTELKNRIVTTFLINEPCCGVFCLFEQFSPDDETVAELSLEKDDCEEIFTSSGL